jgi:DNA-binding PadR family transcriptional regulator
MSESLLKAGSVRASEALETTTVRAHIGGMDALTLQLIVWVSDRPRTYGEVMEAWTTTCPRMPIWEDAVSDGLVRVEGEGRMRERSVSLTPRGRALFRENA